MSENMTYTKFVHLHLHTEYSLLDGATRISALAKKCFKERIPAIAMTDHGNMYATRTFNDEINSVVEKYEEPLKSEKEQLENLEKANPNNEDGQSEERQKRIAILKEKLSEKFKTKLIVGCEFYVCRNHLSKTEREKYAHLILLAKDDDGYKNISKLNTIAFRDGFYYKPRIDYNLLEQYSKGIICLSACIAGDIPTLLLQNRDEEAEELALRLKNMFAEGDFYIEVQNHGLEEELYVLPKLYKLAEKIGVKTVATNDVHYLNKDDQESQDVLMCIQMRKTLDDRNRLRIESDQLYFKSYEEMSELFKDHPESIETTLEIANKCTKVYPSKSDYKFPEYKTETGETSEQFLLRLINEGLQRKYKVVTPQIRERMEYEFGIIKGCGFIDYFLIVWDYINAARKMGISVGPGRGSGAGSIVAYAIDITNIDPLKYELYFERFLNPHRVSAPDFDIDFEDSRRAEVIEYVKQKYGDDHVIKIITFGTMAAKNAIKDVGRVLKIPYSQLDKITKAIPNSIKRPNILEKVFGFKKEKVKVNEEVKEVDVSIPELVDMYNSDEEIRRVVDIAIKLEDMPRQTGIHACGVIISRDPLESQEPLSRNDEFITTQFTGPQMEKLGHLKMDFLGLCNLSDIRLCLKYVKENYGIDIDFDNMEYNEKEVFDLISTGNTKAIFQIESGGFQKFMRNLKPNCLEDIIAGVSLYRPGPMDEIDNFIFNKHNPEKIVYESEKLKDILGYTYGVIVYQEQVMKIVQDLAGFSLSDADNVRKIMGKKMTSKMPEQRKLFIYGGTVEHVKKNKNPDGTNNKEVLHIDGAIKRGIQKEVAEKLWAKMEKFASYAFNKSHAAAYSVITYQTAYLKCHYEAEFLTAVLNNRIGKPDDLKRYMTHAKEEKIEVLPPDINKSEEYFTVKNNKIRFGLAALKNIGISIVKVMVEERNKNGDFTDLKDFIYRMSDYSLNKRMFESLIYSGAMDCFGLKRSQLIAVYENVIRIVEREKKTTSSGQMSFFDFWQDETFKPEVKIEYPNIPEYSTPEKLKHEKEIAGVYISGHPVDKYMDIFKNLNFNSSMLDSFYVPTKSETDENTNDYTSLDDDDEVNQYKLSEDENTLKNNSPVSFGGIISEVKKTYTKKNEEMAILTVEDLNGSIDVLVFPSAYKKYRDIIEEDLIAVFDGTFSAKNDGTKPSVILNTINLLETEDNTETDKKTTIAPPPKGAKLCLKFDTKDKKILSTILNLLSNYKGNSEVYIRCSTTNEAFKVDFGVNITKNLLNELSGYLSVENVRLF